MKSERIKKEGKGRIGGEDGAMRGEVAVRALKRCWRGYAFFTRGVKVGALGRTFRDRSVFKSADLVLYFVRKHHRNAVNNGLKFS